MFILRLLAVVIVVSYIIWFFNARFIGNNVSFFKVSSWVTLATFAIYVFLAGVSFLVENF
jgi:hypothetical protein